MQQDIHPKFHTDTKVTCACDHTFTTSSTQKSIDVEICSHCHPFFTGKAKYVDTQGRVEKFQQKMAAAKKHQPKKKKKKTSSDDQKPKTLKDMLKEQVKKDQD